MSFKEIGLYLPCYWRAIQKTLKPFAFSGFIHLININNTGQWKKDVIYLLTPFYPYS